MPGKKRGPWKQFNFRMSENPNQPAPEPPQSQPAQPTSPPSAPPQPAPVKKNNGETLRKLNSPLFIWPAAIALAALLYFGLWLLANTLTHESTDDAFIAGHIVSIAPRISGQVSTVYVLDNQMVRSNDLLVEIDPADYETTLSQKQAAQHSAESNFKAAVAGYNLMGVKVTTAEATAKESKADADAAAASAAKAKADFVRAQSLRTNETISAQEFDQAKAAAEEAEANFNSAKQKADADGSKVDEAKAQLEAAKAESDAVFAQLNESKTAVDTA